MLWQVAPRAAGVLLLIGLVLIATRMMVDGPTASQEAFAASGSAATASQAPDLSGWRIQPEAAAPVALAEAPKRAPEADTATQVSGNAAVEARMSAVSAIAPPVAATPPPVVASVTPDAPSQTPTAPVEDGRFAWPEAAVKCPRTWIAGPSSDASGTPSPACHEFGAPPVSGIAEPSLDPVEAGSPIEVARLPMARPANPPKLAEAPKRRSRSRQSSRGWPAGPPPDCGSKRARWRYTDRKQGTKVWYCK